MLSDNYQINHLTTRVKYSFLIKNIRPYIGIGVGYFQKKYDMPFSESYSEKGLGLNPSIGVIFNSNIAENLFFNTNISYYKVYTDHALDLYSFNIGLLYYFNKDDN
jgi:outer membrane protein W